MTKQLPSYQIRLIVLALDAMVKIQSNLKVVDSFWGFIVILAINGFSFIILAVTVTKMIIYTLFTYFWFIFLNKFSTGIFILLTTDQAVFITSECEQVK